MPRREARPRPRRHSGDKHRSLDTACRQPCHCPHIRHSRCPDNQGKSRRLNHRIRDNYEPRGTSGICGVARAQRHRFPMHSRHSSLLVGCPLGRRRGVSRRGGAETRQWTVDNSSGLPLCQWVRARISRNLPAPTAAPRAIIPPEHGRHQASPGGLCRASGPPPLRRPQPPNRRLHPRCHGPRFRLDHPLLRLLNRFE